MVQTDAFNDFAGFGFNFDIVANIIDPSGNGVSLGVIPTRVFTLTFTVDPSTVVGTEFDLTLIDLPDVPLFDATGSNLGTPFIGNQGRIIVSSLGDIDRNGLVNLLDVSPFVSLLASSQFQVEGDINMDGLVNLLDVNGFVLLLTGG